jgi:hypothetical protein
MVGSEFAPSAVLGMLSFRTLSYGRIEIDVGKTALAPRPNDLAAIIGTSSRACSRVVAGSDTRFPSRMIRHLVEQFQIEASLISIAEV